jgi:hypothetical protein
MRLFLNPPPQLIGFGSPTQRPFSVSPDGKQVAYMTQNLRHGGGVDLWVQPLSGEAERIEGMHSARWPFWSADSQSVAFFADGQIKKVGVAGGAAETICEGTMLYGAAWAADGTILFANQDGVYRVQAEGGKPQRVLTPKPGVVYFDPVLLPDGEHYLLSRFDTARVGSILLLPLSGGPERVVLRNATNAVWISSGHILFVRGEILMAQRFDLRRFEVAGDPVVLSDRVGVLRRETMNALFSASRDGRVIAFQPTLSSAMR